MNATIRKTRSALRQSLQAEDDSIEKRLPESGGTATRTAAAKPAAEDGGAKTAPKAAAGRKKASPAKASPRKAAAPAPASDGAVPAKRRGAAKAASGAAEASSVAASPAAAPASAPATEPPGSRVKKRAVKDASGGDGQSDAKTKKKREKVVRDSFSMPKSEHGLLKQLRATLAKKGRICTKSELVRAGVQLVAAMKPGDLLRAIDGLAPVAKGKAKK